MKYMTTHQENIDQTLICNTVTYVQIYMEWFIIIHPKLIIYYRQDIPHSEVKIIIKQSYNKVTLDIPLCVTLLQISM